MNIWMGKLSLVFIFVTAISIGLKHKNFRSMVWSMLLFMVTAIAFWFGIGAKQIWLILFCSIIIGGCVLITWVHGYSRLFTSGKTYKAVGEDKKPRSFGNGYWR